MTKIDINTQDDLTNLFNMSEAELEQITHFSIVRYRNMNRFLQIAEIFPRCSNLITLKINYGCMDIHELEQIIGILPQCRKLTNLDFRNNYDRKNSFIKGENNYYKPDETSPLINS